MYIFFDSRHDYEGYPPVSGQYEFSNENIKAREKGFFWRVIQELRSYLKVPKREIFTRSDFLDFYTIKSSWVGDLLLKILTYYFNF